MEYTSENKNKLKTILVVALSILLFLAAINSVWQFIPSTGKAISTEITTILSNTDSSVYPENCLKIDAISCNYNEENDSMEYVYRCCTKNSCKSNEWSSEIYVSKTNECLDKTSVQYSCGGPGNKEAIAIKETCSSADSCTPFGCVQESKCYDSDLGINPSIAGGVTNGLATWEDSCSLDKNSLTEHFCDGNTPDSVVISCKPGTCINNKCITECPCCDDSDKSTKSGAVDSLFIKGRVVFSSMNLSHPETCASCSFITEADSCISDTIIKEGSCQGHYKVSEIRSCPSGTKCKDGRCVNPYLCIDSDGELKHKDEKTIQGTVTIQLRDSTLELKDTCTGEKTLVEYGCFGWKATSSKPQAAVKKVVCKYKCVNGACTSED